MTDHLPDCDDYAFSGAGFHPNCERVCICRQVRRIEQRVRDAHIAILESARPSGKCDCDWCAEHDWLISDLIHALKEKP